MLDYPAFCSYVFASVATNIGPSRQEFPRNTPADLLEQAQAPLLVRQRGIEHIDLYPNVTALCNHDVSGTSPIRGGLVICIMLRDKECSCVGKCTWILKELGRESTKKRDYRNCMAEILCLFSTQRHFWKYWRKAVYMVLRARAVVLAQDPC